MVQRPTHTFCVVLENGPPTHFDSETPPCHWNISMGFITQGILMTTLERTSRMRIYVHIENLIHLKSTMYITPTITHKWGTGNNWNIRVLGISRTIVGSQCNSLTPIRIYHTPPSPPLPIIPSGGGVPTQTRIHDLAALASYP